VEEKPKTHPQKTRMGHPASGLEGLSYRVVLVDGDLLGGGGLAELIGHVEGVGGGCGGGDLHGGAADCADCGGDDDVVGGCDLPAESYGGAGRDGIGRGGESRDGGIRAGGDIRVGVEGRQR